MTENTTHLYRLQALHAVGVPADLARMVHQTRLTQVAREGAQMSTQHLRDLGDTRRYATLVALVLDTQATVIDQVLELHDKHVGKLFAEVKRKHEAAFAAQGKAINEKVRHYSSVGQAVIEARARGTDPSPRSSRCCPGRGLPRASRRRQSWRGRQRLTRCSSWPRGTVSCTATRRACWKA